MVKQKNYPHHSTDPEAEMDGIDADDSLVGVLHDSIEKAQVVCRHCKKSLKEQVCNQEFFSPLV